MSQLSLSSILIPPWVKWAGLAALVGIILAAGWYFKGLKDDNAQLRADQAALVARIETAESNLSHLDQTFVKRDELNTEVRNNIATVTGRIKQEAAHDAPTRNFTTTVLPDGLRRAILKDRPASTPRSTGTDSTNPN